MSACVTIFYFLLIFDRLKRQAEKFSPSLIVLTRFYLMLTWILFYKVKIIIREFAGRAAYTVLKRQKGYFSVMIHAVIDMGSNSVRMSVYRCEDQEITLLMNQKRTIGLAGCVENGLLTSEGIRRATQVIAEFKGIAEAFQIGSLSAFATASLRNIANQEQVLHELTLAAGITPEVISGEEEARLDFIGSTRFLNLDTGVLVDIGGGSTELVLFEDGKALNVSSFPIGSLNLYVDHVGGVFPEKAERKDIKRHIRAEFQKLCWKPEQAVPLLCAVGGTARAFKKLCTELLSVPADEKSLQVKYLEELHRMLKQENSELRRRFYQVVPERILNIQPGLMLLRETARLFGSREIVVSPYGVREGYLIDKVLKKQ